MVKLDSKFYRRISKIGLKNRWKKEHAKVKINPRLSKEKIAINAYLCGDGWIKIRKEKNRKNAIHYEIRIFQKNLELAKRIVRLFKKEFNITPTIKEGKGCFYVQIKNKPVCLNLISLGNYGGLEWNIPKNLNKEFLIEWIKCFFDCEAYVNHVSRTIQVKSINHDGLVNIQKALEVLGINSRVYGPYKQKSKKHNDYSMLTILKNEVIKYKNLINFYHPDRRKKLNNIV